jgi:hypothetical protein
MIIPLHLPPRALPRRIPLPPILPRILNEQPLAATLRLLQVALPDELDVENPPAEAREALGGGCDGIGVGVLIE